MEAKHHIFPRFLLERFAKDGQIAMRARDGGRVLRTSAIRAAKEGDFYTLAQRVAVPAEDVAEPYELLGADPRLRDRIIDITGEEAVLRPDAIESFLGFVEGSARPAIDALVAEGPPPMTQNWDRFWIASLIAVQHTRGRAFRSMVDESFRTFARLHIERNPEDTTRRWRKMEQRNGDARIDDPVAHLTEHLEQVRVNDDPKLGLALSLAFDEIAPRLFVAPWRLLRFDVPDVITSDEGVGLWARPDRDLYLRPVGIASADVVFFPVDANHILAVLPNAAVAEQRTVAGSRTKLRQSNVAVATAAEQWIYAHPDTSELVDIQVGPRATFKIESLGSARNGDVVREQFRTYRA